MVYALRLLTWQGKWLLTLRRKASCTSRLNPSNIRGKDFSIRLAQNKSKALAVTV